MGRVGKVYVICFLLAVLLAVPLEAVSVNPSLCPTNKIAPHKRLASWEHGTGRTFGAFYDLLGPGNLPYGNRPYGNRPYGNPPYDSPNYQNDLQEKPQEDDPTDCGEIEDYDENDLSSLTPQGQGYRRQDHRDSRGSDIRTFFGSSHDYPERPPHRPERPPNRPDRPNHPERPPNRPERPPYRPERPSYPQRPLTTNRPQGPTYPAPRPPYWSGGLFGSNEYRPPYDQNPSDNIKPIHEYSENNQVTYRPSIVGGSLGHVVGVSPIIPTSQDEPTTDRTFYDRIRTSTPYSTGYPTRRPRGRNLSSNLFGSFVDLLF